MEKGPSEFAEYWTSPYDEVNHFYFHADEFGFTLITEYSRAALEFARASNDDIISFTANETKNWSTYKYNKKTNEFMIISRNGKIVTYYPPTRGLEYFYERYRMYGHHWN